MFAFVEPYAGLVGVFAALLLVGCQTTSKSPPRSVLVQTPQGVLTCRDCKVSTVQDPVKDPKGRLVGYHKIKLMQCPDCKDEEQPFPSGEGPTITRHTCNTCGQSIVICSMH
jgi:hypothetical protein